MKEAHLFQSAALQRAFNRLFGAGFGLRRNHSLAAVALIAAIASIPAHARAQATAGRIEARLLGLASDTGTARCLMFSSEEGWPADRSKAFRRASSEIHQHQASCVFDDVPPGTYAITAIHDLNDNGKLDKNFLGVPTEPYGFSNDARGTMSAPKFSAASFAYSGGALNLAFTLK